MPIMKPSRFSAPVFYPQKNYAVVKYMDLAKFISLLFKKALFFCRLDKLEDPFEGTTAKRNYEIRKQWHEDSRPLLYQPITDEELLQQVQIMYDHDQRMKALNCISCWNKYENESAALWKIYADFNKGIMIKSSIEKFSDAFEASEKEIQLSEVRYIDFAKDIMLDGNSNYPIIHKQKAYSYEKEVRLIYSIIPETGWMYDWDKEEINEGIYLEVNLINLIDEIVISPFAPHWFFQLVEDVVYKYDLNKKVSKSELSRS